MTLQLNNNSIRELMDLMREAVEANNIVVAICVSEQIHDKLLHIALNLSKM